MSEFGRITDELDARVAALEAQLLASQQECERLRTEAAINNQLTSAAMLGKATAERHVAEQAQAIVKLREALQELRDNLPDKCTCHESYTSREKALGYRFKDPECLFCDLDKVLPNVNAALSRTPKPPVESVGVGLIAAERQRQITAEGWSSDHDDEHDMWQLTRAAVAYCGAVTRYIRGMPTAPEGWPWEDSWWKPSQDPIRNLVKAGALIAAEIDRASRTPKPEGE